MAGAEEADGAAPEAAEGAAVVEVVQAVAARAENGNIPFSNILPKTKVSQLRQAGFRKVLTTTFQ